jgi:transcriptional regulator with XRE-family HTH domain
MARQRLRERRIERGLSKPELAVLLGVDPRMIDRYESGTNSPPLGRRPKYAEALDWTPAELHAALAETEEGRIAGLNGHQVPAWIGHLAEQEQQASRLWSFEPVVVHGLLQTPRYTEAIESVGPGTITQDEVLRKVEIRRMRQAVLTRDPDPLELAVILDESVLHRMAGDRDVMAEQLDHLTDVGIRPNVDIRILPLDAGVFSAAFGAFTLVSKRASTDPYMAWVEDRAGPHYLDRLPEIEVHTTLFRFLSGAALSPAASADLIRTVLKEKYLR